MEIKKWVNECLNCGERFDIPITMTTITTELAICPHCKSQEYKCMFVTFKDIRNTNETKS